MGPGPVFVYGCVTNARRWQTYAARCFGVALLFLGMATIAWSNSEILQGALAREYAQLGEAYFYALIGVELSLVMLAAPVATAGAICLDRARGTLTHILATDLSDTEIVLGKFLGTYRLVPRLTIGPGLMVLTLATVYDGQISIGFGVFRAVMAVATILVHIALNTRIGLALATWIKGQSRAIALSVCAFVFVSVAWPITAYVVESWPGLF